jgi:protein-tyrosine kinase
MQDIDSLCMSRIGLALMARLPARDSGHVVVVTSAQPREGKSFVSRGLAHELSLALQAKVALVDAISPAPAPDRPSPDAPGDADAVIPQGLLQPADGTQAHAALFHGENVARAIERLQQQFKLSIVDAPALADCGALLLHADALLLVVDSQRTAPAAIRRAMAAAQVPASRFVGVALNRAPDNLPAWMDAH